MTHQEATWKGHYVWCVSIMSKNRRIHRYLKPYVGRPGFVHGEAKNGMLLIEFGLSIKSELRCVPSSCVALYGSTRNVR